MPDHEEKARNVNREEQQHSGQMRGPLRRIMIAVDDSKASTQALRFASRVVPRDAQVRIVCAAERPVAWNAGGAYTAGDAGMTDAPGVARDEYLHAAERTLEHAMSAFNGQVALVEGQRVGLSSEAGAVVPAVANAAAD